MERHNVTKQKKQTPSDGTNGLTKNKNQQVKRQETVVKPIRASNTNSGPGRPPKHNVEQISNNNLKLEHRTDKVTGQIKPSVQKNVSFFKFLLVFILCLEKPGFRCLIM